MASKSVGVVFEELFEQMRLFATQIRDFPEPGTLAESHGAASGVAQNFRTEMRGLASDLEFVASQIRDELEETELAVRATARTMADTDASAADTARALIEQLEGIPSAPAPQTTIPVTTAQPKNEIK